MEFKKFMLIISTLLMILSTFFLYSVSASTIINDNGIATDGNFSGDYHLNKTFWSQIQGMPTLFSNLTLFNDTIIQVGNSSWNQSLGDGLYWRLDGANDPPTADWNMGHNDFYMNHGHGYYWLSTEQQIFSVDDDGNMQLVNKNSSALTTFVSYGPIEIRTQDHPGANTAQSIDFHTGDVAGATHSGNINITAGLNLNLISHFGNAYLKSPNLINLSSPTTRVEGNEIVTGNLVAPNICYLNGSQCNTTYYPEIDPVYQSVWRNTSHSISPNRNISFEANITSSFGTSHLNALNLGTALTVSSGGTGATSFNARGVILGGTATTGALQSIAPSATMGVYLRGAGSSANPIWSSLVLPDRCTLSQITFCNASNQYGTSSEMTYGSNIFSLTNTLPSINLVDTTLNSDDLNMSVDSNKFILRWISSNIKFFEATSTGSINISSIGENLTVAGHLIVTTNAAVGGNLAVTQNTTLSGINNTLRMPNLKKLDGTTACSAGDALRWDTGGRIYCG